MYSFFIRLSIVVLGLFHPLTLAEAANFSTAYLNTSSVAFVSSSQAIVAATEGVCQAYNSLENFATVSDTVPLRLTIKNPSAHPLFLYLRNEKLGHITIPKDGIVEISYRDSGTTELEGFAGNSKVLSVPIEFLSTQNMVVNFYHIHDPSGYTSWKMKQSLMQEYFQESQSILNQAGVSLVIREQKNIYLHTSIGSSLDANQDNLSYEEIAVLNHAPLSKDAVSVFIVWDYKIAQESKSGMSYVLQSGERVVFISDKSTKSGETLAHELLHAVGLKHNLLGSSYLMTPQEYPGMDQCVLSRSEVQQIARGI